MHAALAFGVSGMLSVKERSGPKGSPVSVKRETDLHRPEASVDPERTVVSVLIIIFVHVLAGAVVVRSLQSSRTDSR